MMTTTLLTLLAAAEVSTSSAPAEPVEPPRWGLQLSLASPSLIGASFELGPGTSGLGGIGGLSGLGGLGGIGVLGNTARPTFSNALTVERAFGEKWSGVASLSVGYSAYATPFSTLSGGGMVGARWYAKRVFDGFFAGPEVGFQANVTDASALGLMSFRTYAGGVRARAGWTQPFGEHFVISASAGLGANLAWMTAPISQQTLSLGLDLTLAAGLVF